MNVSGIKAYSYGAPKMAFKGEEAQTAPMTEEAGSEKKITKKQIGIAAGIAAAGAAIAAVAVAAKRGKLVADIPEGKDKAKFFTRVKEGFKTFTGDTRKKYLENLQEKLNNDGNTEKAEKIGKKIDKLNKVANEGVQEGAKEGTKAAEEGVKTAAEGAKPVTETAAEGVQEAVKPVTETAGEVVEKAGEEIAK